MSALLDTFGIDWQLLLAQAVNFGVVLFALWYFLYRPVIRMLEKRREIVARGVEDAEKAGAMLASADVAVSHKLQSAETEADGVMRAARSQASTERSQIMHDAQIRAVQLAKDAEARARETTLRIHKESERDIARLALLAAEKILKASHE